MGSRKFTRDRTTRPENSEQAGRNYRFTILGAAEDLRSDGALFHRRVESLQSTIHMGNGLRRGGSGSLVGYFESDLGSRPYFRLLIDDDKRGRILVRVMPTLIIGRK